MLLARRSSQRSLCRQVLGIISQSQGFLFVIYSLTLFQIIPFIFSFIISVLLNVFESSYKALERIHGYISGAVI